MLMPLPGISEQNKLIPLLRMLISDQTEVFKFAVAASSPKEGVLCMSKKEKLKKKEVRSEAEADAKEANGGKAVKLEVMTGECHRDEQSDTTLRLVIYGKAPAKAVACIEHLLVRGPYKVAGFKRVIIEEVADEDEEAPATATVGGEASPDGLPDEQANWEKALAAIEPDYLQGVRDRPDLASKLRAVMDFAQGKAETGAYPAALAALKKLAELLGTGPASPSEDKTTPPATAGAAAGDPAPLFNERLKALLPDIKAAAGTPAGDEAKLKVSEASVFARKKDFVQANASLDQVQAALQHVDAPAAIAAQLAAAPAAGVDPAAEWERRVTELEPKVLEAQTTRAGEAEWMTMFMTAQDLGSNGDFAKSFVILEKLEALLNAKPAATDVSAPGLVKKRQFLLERWQRIPQEVSADLRKLKAAIEREMPSEDADELIELSEDYLDEFYSEMKDAIDNAIISGDAQYKGAISAIGAFRTKIAGEPLIQHLKKNTLNADVTVESILLNALAEIEKGLAS